MKEMEFKVEIDVRGTYYADTLEECKELIREDYPNLEMEDEVRIDNEVIEL